MGTLKSNNIYCVCSGTAFWYVENFYRCSFVIIPKIICEERNKMTKKEKNMEKVFISIMSNLLKDEAKVIKKHKFYSRFLHYVFLIYIAIITVFYARNQGEGQAIFMLCHGVILGSLLWLSIWFEAASLQLPIMKRYWDIEKFYKETGEYDIFD